MPGNWHVLFGKGPTEKARVTGTSPAAYFTLKASGGPRDPSLSQRPLVPEGPSMPLQRRHPASEAARICSQGRLSLTFDTGGEGAEPSDFQSALLVTLGLGAWDGGEVTGTKVDWLV